MTIELGANRYGKSAIRLVKLVRGADRDVVRDLTIDIALEGDFVAAHTARDNSRVIATDTMKNTAYALAADSLGADTPIEAFGIVLGRHFAAIEQVTSVEVSIAEHDWRPVATSSGVAGHAFTRAGGGTRRAVVRLAADGAVDVRAGIDDLTVMKTSGSAFAGFPRDAKTTLADTDDRILATRIEARWRYGGGELDHNAEYVAVVATLLESFAEHESASVQHSIWVMGHAILDRHPAVTEVTMRLPNLHHWLVDLSPFGVENDRSVFLATREPYGLIEATVRRGAADG
ncbi:MAG: factor-independent urate hydroxylase [Chloroflexota bacterium]